MSAASIRSIYDEAALRLATVTPGEETLAIGLDYFEAIGAHLAVTIYLRTAAENFGSPQVNTIILSTHDDLLRMVSDTFSAFGMEDGDYLRRCQDAAERGFLDRGEVLFSIESAGGSA